MYSKWLRQNLVLHLRTWIWDLTPQKLNPQILFGLFFCLRWVSLPFWSWNTYLHILQGTHIDEAFVTPAFSAAQLSSTVFVCWACVIVQLRSYYPVIKNIPAFRYLTSLSLISHKAVLLHYSTTLPDLNTVHVAFQSNPIYLALCERNHYKGFPAAQVPRVKEYHKVYEQLHDLLTLRIRTEQDLMDMLQDKAADGAAVRPHRDFEKDYKRLDRLYTDINRAMYIIYTEFLRNTPLTYTQRPPPSLLMLLPR
jgi:hypothetical protein